MDKNAEEILRPEQAESIIGRSRQAIRDSRKWHAIFFLTAGLATAAFFAVIGGVPRTYWENYEIFLLVLPVLFYQWIAFLRKKHPTTGSRETLRFESRVAGVYTVLLLAAVAACVFVLRQGTLSAALIGILPALPCFYGAWKVRP